jgi:hypothetical protein
MGFMRAIILAIFCFFLAGCFDDTKCIEGHITMIPMYNAALKMTTMQPIFVCDKKELNNNI